MDELTLQLRLAREAAARTALAYAHAGFAVAIDDFWQGGTQGADHLPFLGTACQRVLSQATALVRADIKRHPKMGWQVVDFSDLTVEETVDLILTRTRTGPA